MSSSTRPSALGLGALQSVLPAELIESVLQECGCRGKRRRKLPPAVVVWLVVGMGLFRSLSIATVLRRVRDCLGEALSWGPAEIPHSTSITQARDRVGRDVVRVLFEKLSALLSKKHAASDSWHGKTACVLDGTTFDAADTEANEAAFGRAGTSRGGKSAFPQLRAVMLMGAWTHLLSAVALGSYRTGELSLAQHVLSQVKAGMLLLLDRAYYSFAWLSDLKRQKADFVVRIKQGRASLQPKVRRRLGPGDRLAVLPIPVALRRRRSDLPRELPVRLVTLRRNGFRPVTLATSLLDAEAFPAKEIAALYLDRWEAELGYRELKIHLGNRDAVFRSQRPDRVEQEAYGLLIAFNCVRALMAEAAENAGLRPIELSFTNCLEHIRLELIRLAAHNDPASLVDLLDALARYRLPPRRRGRTCERAVKRKMSNYPRKTSRPKGSDYAKAPNPPRNASCGLTIRH